jgi:hypothetical protein
MSRYFFHFSPPPVVSFLFSALLAFLGGKEKDDRKGKRRWKALQRKWLLSSDHWDLLNVFSRPEIKYSGLEWMTVFSSYYPSTSSKACVDMLTRIIPCVNSHTTGQMRERAR